MWLLRACTASGLEGTRCTTAHVDHAPLLTTTTRPWGCLMVQVAATCTRRPTRVGPSWSTL